MPEQNCFFDKEGVVSEDGRAPYLIDRELCQSGLVHLIKSQLCIH